MVKFCFGCKNNSRSKCNIGYFTFPKQESRCALWFKAINRTRLTKHTAEYCHTNLVLCSEHFDAKDVSLNTKRKRLNGYAIPIIRPLNIAQGEPSQSTTLVQQNQPNPSNEGNSEVLMEGSILSQVESLTSGEPSHSTTVVQENQPNPSDEGNSEVLMEGSILTEVESLTSVSEIEVGLPETTVLEETPSTSKLDTEKLSPQAGPSKEFQFSKTDVSTETSSFLSANTPRKIGLKRKVRQLAQQIRRSGGNQESSQKPDIMPQDVFNFFHEKYNPDIANFIAMQMNLLNKNPKGARYTSEYKQFAMTLYFLGPKCYKFLAKTLRLPSKSTLINITKKWPINPGLNDFVFNVLKNQVANMVEGSKDCILCIDEMSLKSNFHYNIARDELTGFHQTIDKKTFKPGNNALVLMLRGINSNWKQPLGYFFVNSTCPVEDLKTILFESIRRIDSVNLRLRIVVSDQGSNFFKLTNTLKITPENPYFYVDDLKIYYMFDVPHLLKSTRNNFFKYSLYFNDKKTSKEYLNTLYANDKTQAYRLVPKLTDAHVNPTNFQKMKVKYAAQVFSSRVAAALNMYVSSGVIEKDAMFTIEFIDKIDKLFDLLNSSRFKETKSFNRAFMGASLQIIFPTEMLKFFENLKVKNNNGKEIKVKFIYGWKLTISAFLNFWNDFKASGNNHVFTRRLNQDSLECKKLVYV